MSINVRDVSFAYDNTRTILTNASLEAHRGQLVAVLGPSGSGKSTLLRLIAGILPKSGTSQIMRGQILLNGNLAKDSSLKPGQLSLMFQEPVLLPNRTVAQNIALPLEMLRLPRLTIQERVTSVLAEIGLSKLRHLRPSQLSVGMKTRVSLAMTVITQPTFLLLDEPFSSLDFAWRLSLYRTLTAIRNASQPTILLVTHDLREAILLADSIVVLRSDGRTMSPTRIDVSKPVRFTTEELDHYTTISLREYTALEQSLVSATDLLEAAQEPL
jgi:ABC-type nitrate/sulfonate/bicarbonate transport system ATPase subunit